jgi:hypothetical protein
LSARVAIVPFLANPLESSPDSIIERLSGTCGEPNNTLNIYQCESSRMGPISLSPVENLWILLLIIFSEFYYEKNLWIYLWILNDIQR